MSYYVSTSASAATTPSIASAPKSTASSSNSTTPDSATAGGGAKVAEEHGGHHEVLIRVNLFLFACMGLWILVRLPRTLALLRTPSERSRGHILTYKRIDYSAQRYAPGGGGMDNGTSAYPFVPNSPTTRTKKKGPRPPPHVGGCPAFLRPLLVPLRSRMVSGVSGGQLLMVVAYFYLMAYACMYKANLLTDGGRTGWVSVSQLPVLYALAQKSSFLATLLGVGYEKLNFLHRFVGLVCVTTANLHSLRFIYKRMFEGMPAFLAFIKRPANMWGLVATICFNIAFLFFT